MLSILNVIAAEAVAKISCSLLKHLKYYLHLLFQQKKIDKSNNNNNNNNNNKHIYNII